MVAVRICRVRWPCAPLGAGLPANNVGAVRLASEIFRRCVAKRAAAGQAQPVTLYDPCCGGAYHLSALP